MPDNSTLLTDAATTPTAQTGKGVAASGNADDATLRGLTERVEKEKAKRESAEAKLAEVILKLSETEEKGTKAERLEKENIALKTVLRYPDVADKLKNGIDKGILNADLIDDDFVAVLRAARDSGATPTPVEDGETPAHNPVRSTSPSSAMERLKGMEWPE